MRSWDEAIPQRASDEGALEAMLLSVGARGYDKATVQEVLERSGISRDRFQRHFGGKEACFAQAYEMAADRLCAEVLEAGREAESWRARYLTPATVFPASPVWWSGTLRPLHATT